MYNIMLYVSRIGLKRVTELNFTTLLQVYLQCIEYDFMYKVDYVHTKEHAYTSQELTFKT